MSKSRNIALRPGQGVVFVAQDIQMVSLKPCSSTNEQRDLVVT